MTRLGLGLGLALMLAGCDGAPLSTPGGASDARPAPLSRVSLAGGVVVAGPQGYCIDPATSKSGATRSFAVMASCLILSGGQVGSYVPPAMITVAVGPRGDTSDLPSAATLAEVSGAPLLAQMREDGLVIAHLGRGGDDVLDGGDPAYWRGAFLQNGRVIGLALYAPNGDAMAGKAGAAMLQRVRDSIRQANTAAKPAVLATSSGAALPERPTEKAAQKGVLSRLFGPAGLP